MLVVVSVDEEKVRVLRSEEAEASMSLNFSSKKCGHSAIFHFPDIIFITLKFVMPLYCNFGETWVVFLVARRKRHRKIHRAVFFGMEVVLSAR